MENISNNEVKKVSDEVAFKIFRYKDAPTLEESEIMPTQERSSKVTGRLMECLDAGLMEGADARVVFRGAGISVIHAWFKSYFPLALHSHDADCFYYIIAGGLRLGREELSAGDGFLIPADVPYTYRAGAEGVELIEIRNSEETFDYRENSTNAFWQKATRIVSENREHWAGEKRMTKVGA